MKRSAAAGEPATKRSSTDSSKVYAAIGKKTDILFGCGFDKVPEGKRGKQEAQPVTVGQGYGELTYGGANKVLDAIGRDWDSYVDVGSGFGRMVSLFAMQTEATEVVGIEYQEVRHYAAVDAAEELGKTYPRMKEIYFMQGDANDITIREEVVYMYDKLFKDSFYDTYLPKLSDSPCEVFACYRNEAFLVKHGLEGFVFTESVSVSTTGKQKHTCYIYRRKPIVVD